MDTTLNLSLIYFYSHFQVFCLTKRAHQNLQFFLSKYVFERPIPPPKVRSNCDIKSKAYEYLGKQLEIQTIVISIFSIFLPITIN